MRPKLRIGLLVNSYELSTWEYVLIERLINSHYASIELVILNDRETTKRTLLRRIKDNWKHILFALYARLDRKLFNVHPNAFEPKDATALLDGIPVVKAKPIAATFSDFLRDEDIAQITNHKLDLLIRFGFRILRGDVFQSAKYGIWSYHHGDNNVNRGGPAGCWEVMERWAEMGSMLQIITEDLDDGQVLYRSFSQVDRRSIHRNANSVYWKSLSFLSRKLEELHSVGEDEFFKRVDKLNKRPNFYSNRFFTTPGNWRMLKLIAVHLFRFVRNKCVDLAYLDQWILLFRIRTGLSTSLWRFNRIVPPRDRLFMDPFIIQKDNNYYIFIEELIRGSDRGHISVITMDEGGNYGKPVTVMEKSYHLSYPFVFEYGDDCYLVPESRANRTIQLYKCIDFPSKWEFQMNLMENIEAVDATLFHHEGKWWLFANIVENPGASSSDELFLFYSEELHTKDWIPHPLNPVVSDVKRARPAGRVLVHEGRTLRPSQDCSQRYGHGVRINEITTLNEDEYDEVEIASIGPNWDKRVMAVHTFNCTGDLTVVDGLLRRRRFF